MNAKPHYLIVGECDTCAPKVCDCKEVGADPTHSLSIECPGVTDNCMAYVECHKEHEDLDAIEETIDEDGEAEVHGEIHRYLDGGLCVETGNCWFQLADYYEAAQLAFEDADKEMVPGRYAIDGHDPDFGCIELTLIDEPDEVAS